MNQRLLNLTKHPCRPAVERGREAISVTKRYGGVDNRIQIVGEIRASKLANYASDNVFVKLYEEQKDRIVVQDAGVLVSPHNSCWSAIGGAYAVRHFTQC